MNSPGWRGAALRAKRSLVPFPIRAHAWVGGQVPVGGTGEAAVRSISPSILPPFPSL